MVPDAAEVIGALEDVKSSMPSRLSAIAIAMPLKPAPTIATLTTAPAPRAASPG